MCSICICIVIRQTITDPSRWGKMSVQRLKLRIDCTAMDSVKIHCLLISIYQMRLLLDHLDMAHYTCSVIYSYLIHWNTAASALSSRWSMVVFGSTAQGTCHSISGFWQHEWQVFLDTWEKRANAEYALSRSEKGEEEAIPRWRSHRVRRRSVLEKCHLLSWARFITGRRKVGVGRIMMFVHHDIHHSDWELNALLARERRLSPERICSISVSGTQPIVWSWSAILKSQRPGRCQKALTNIVCDLLAPLPVLLILFAAIRLPSHYFILPLTFTREVSCGPSSTSGLLKWCFHEVYEAAWNSLTRESIAWRYKQVYEEGRGCASPQLW